MNFPKNYQNICRICLDENVVLNWNNTLFECYGVTYKDCYYKYTQLEYLADDPFSPMLCETCLNILQNFHTLILKAIESHKYFTKTWSIDSEINDDPSIEENEQKYTPTEFETILVEEICVETEKEIDDDKKNKEKEEQICKKQDLTCETLTITEEQTNISENEKKSYKKDKELKIQNNDKSLKYKIDNCKVKKRFKTDMETKKELNVSNDKEDLNELKVKCKVKKNDNKKKEKSYICSICSKVFPKLSAAKMHEKTHVENRIRKETCDICGLKFFNKSNLRGHLRIHNNDREKKHKCESCDKAFYNKSSLNVHRRIHLGQMIPCSLCSKEFLRQVDLDLHMNSHSATALNGVTKKRSRYWIRCKYCNKTMLSTSFRSHTAVHLNQPLMKCLLCDKEFFRRESCTDHLKTRHHKKVNEYNEFIEIYEKKRFSHLLLEQTADIIPEDE